MKGENTEKREEVTKGKQLKCFAGAVFRIFEPPK
jgi:hypothetical protein